MNIHEPHRQVPTWNIQGPLGIVNTPPDIRYTLFYGYTVFYSTAALSTVYSIRGICGISLGYGMAWTIYAERMHPTGGKY